MPLGTTYVNNQVCAVSGGVTRCLSTTEAATMLGAGNYVTPSANFAVQYNNVTIHGYTGVPIPTDAALKTFLLANAPVS